MLEARYTEPPYNELSLIPCSWAKENEWGPCWDPMMAATTANATNSSSSSSSSVISSGNTYPDGFINGTFVVDVLGFTDADIGFSCGMLAILTFGYRFLAFLALWGHAQPCCAYGCCKRA